MPGLRSPAVLAWLRLSRVFAKVERRATAHLRPYGLSYGQFDVLAHVGAAPGLSQQALANALLVTKGNVAQLLQKMEATGLLARRPHGRANGLYLTPRGQQLFDIVVPAHEALLADLLVGLTPAEQAALHRLLRTLDRSLL